MSTSTTFLLQTGRHYQNPKNQSTQCRTVPPVKYITLLCNLFPNASKLKPQRLVQDALAQNENKLNSKVKPTQKAIKSAVKHIYSKIDAPFQRVFKVSFAEAQTKVSELDLQAKKNKIQKKHERRQRARQKKQKVEKEWSKRDTDTMLATRQSYSQRARGTLFSLRPRSKLLQGLGNGRDRKRAAKERKNAILRHQIRYDAAEVRLGNMVVKEYLVVTCTHWYVTHLFNIGSYARGQPTKQQERHFSTFSSISLATSSQRPGEIITPGMIRMQAELKQQERSSFQEKESRLGKLLK
ncbi:hypothetical protein ACROYT_G015015 [Oculina patagonica]